MGRASNQGCRRWPYEAYQFQIGVATFRLGQKPSFKKLTTISSCKPELAASQSCLLTKRCQKKCRTQTMQYRYKDGYPYIAGVQNKFTLDLAANCGPMLANFKFSAALALIMNHGLLLTDRGKAMGCSKNSVMINSFIDWLTRLHLLKAMSTVLPSPTPLLRKGVLNDRLELNSSSGFKSLKPRQDYNTLDFKSCYGGLWSLSHFVGTETCFYTVKLTVPSFV